MFGSVLFYVLFAACGILLLSRDHDRDDRTWLKWLDLFFIVYALVRLVEGAVRVWQGDGWSWDCSPLYAVMNVVLGYCLGDMVAAMRRRGERVEGRRA